MDRFHPLKASYGDLQVQLDLQSQAKGFSKTERGIDGILVEVEGDREFDQGFSEFLGQIDGYLPSSQGSPYLKTKFASAFREWIARHSSEIVHSLKPHGRFGEEEHRERSAGSFSKEPKLPDCRCEVPSSSRGHDRPSSRSSWPHPQGIGQHHL